MLGSDKPQRPAGFYESWDKFIVCVLSDVRNRLTSDIIKCDSIYNNLSSNIASIESACKIIERKNWSHFTKLVDTLHSISSTFNNISIWTILFPYSELVLTPMALISAIDGTTVKIVKKYRKIVTVIKNTTSEFKEDFDFNSLLTKSATMDFFSVTLDRALASNKSKESHEDRIIQIDTIYQMCVRSTIQNLVELNFQESN